MNEPDDLVRAALLAHEQEAPAGTALLAGVRHREARRRRRIQLAGATATVVAVASISVAAALLAGHPATRVSAGPTPAAPRPAHSITPLPTLTSSSPSPSASAAARVPAGTQAVSLAGVEVFVPKAWKLNDLRCGTPQHDTAIEGAGLSDEFCGSLQPAGLTVVRVEKVAPPFGVLRAAVATRPTTVDGVPARIGSGVPHDLPGAITALVLPRQGVVVSVQSPDHAEAARIFATLRIVSADANGCATTMPSLTPPGTGTAAAGGLVVPAHPTTAVICRYSSGQLAQSTPLSAGQRSPMTAILRALKPGIGEPSGATNCVQAAGRGFVLHLGSRDASAAAIAVRIEGCDGLYATDGSHVAKIDAALVDTLDEISGYDGYLPGPGEYG